MSEIKFFKTPADWRKWLEKHHDNKSELLVGFYKKNTGKPSITWPESVDEALCFGWIDGIRRSIDDESYSIRFTPRKPRSTWSAVNIKRVEALKKEGKMREAGLKAFAALDVKRAEIYSYEQRKPELDETYTVKLKANKKAWTYFQSRPPWYRRTAGYWIMSAKKEETRLKRLSILIEDSANGKTIAPLTRK